MRAIVPIMRFGPVFFGLGFLAPVIAAALLRLGMAAPFGLSPLTLGLIVGGMLGSLAMVRRRWI